MSLSVGVSPAVAASTYHPVERWPSPTWHLDNPSGVAVDTAGNTYVADTDNNCVRKYGPDRVLIAVWGTLGTGDGQFKKPMDVAVDGLGYVYVADAGNHRIQKLTTSGVFVARWGSQGGPDLSGSADGEFNDPRGISVDGAGNVYVADTGNDRVQKFAPSWRRFCPSGATPGTHRVSSTAPRALRLRPAGPCSWPTTSTAAYRSSDPTDSSSMPGVCRLFHICRLLHLWALP
jgi:DNA-binding beta-propeller fold protein YncE